MEYQVLKFQPITRQYNSVKKGKTLLLFLIYFTESDQILKQWKLIQNYRVLGRCIWLIEIYFKDSNGLSKGKENLI